MSGAAVLLSFSSSKREHRIRTTTYPLQGEVAATETLMNLSFFLDTHTLLTYQSQFYQNLFPLSPVTHLTHQQQPQSPPTLPLWRALRSAFRATASATKIFPSQYHPANPTNERRPTYLHTRAHRVRWSDPLRPDRIYLAELLDVDDVDPPAHDFVEAGVGGLEASLDVAHCLVL